jgi:hypothetical protein
MKYFNKIRIKFTPYLFLLCCLLFLANGCTSIRQQNPALNPSPPETFNYQSYTDVLSGYVDQKGLVNYRQLVANPTGLEEFYSQIATYSPDSHPQLFPTGNDRLAYWINGYNATVLKGVVHSYPIDSVEMVKPPALLFFLPDTSGFFLFQRFTYGGRETNLYNLENAVIRERFQDPRIHFALNCASRSCPELPRLPFYPETLDQQLEAETIKFINDRRNVRYDEEQHTLYLSSIFAWYREDFTSWLNKHHPGKKPTLPGYVQLYLTPRMSSAIENRQETMTIEFLPYDWGLNDQMQ